MSAFGLLKLTKRPVYAAMVLLVCCQWFSGNFKNGKCMFLDYTTSVWFTWTRHWSNTINGRSSVLCRDCLATWQGKGNYHRAMHRLMLCRGRVMKLLNYGDLANMTIYNHAISHCSDQKWVIVCGLPITQLVNWNAKINPKLVVVIDTIIHMPMVPLDTHKQ